MKKLFIFIIAFAIVTSCSNSGEQTNQNQSLDEFLKNIKDQFEEQGFDISIDDKLTQIKGYDSMTALMIISMLEEEYSLLISAEDLNDDLTLKSLFNKIN